MRKASRLQAGFTLTELMAVVIIVGILAVTGITYFRKHANATKVTEAQAMVQSIRAAQERYRAENRQYLPISSSWPECSSRAGLYPAPPDGKSRPFFLEQGSTANDTNLLWWELKPTVSGLVRFGYAVRAGPAGTAIPLPPDLANPPTMPTTTDSWYSILAIGDTDNDGVCCVVVATSLNGELIVQNEGE